MPLEKLMISNFQIHRKRIVELSPYVNTIIGSNDKGKSTILRSLKWLCLNRPNVSGLVHWDASLVKVSLFVDDSKIVRKKGDGINSYVLDGKKFKALHTGVVPEDIEKLLNVSDLNFQNQISGPYWFDLTPGKISKEINQIVNLGSIDNSLGYISSELRRSTIECSLIEDRLKDLKEQKDDLLWIVQADMDYKIIEDNESTLAKIRSKTNSLASSIKNVQSVITEQKNAKNAILDLSTIEDLGNDAGKLRSSMKSLSSIIGEIESITYAELPDLSSLGKLISINKKRMELDSLISKIENEEDTRCQLESDLLEKENILHKGLKGKKCPVCGKPI